MTNLAVILVRPRFPENIGMVARACANMGCQELILVQPERWEKAKAQPLATPKGMPILDTLKICPDLPTAIAPCQTIIGTTARLGGWRRAVVDPVKAAGIIQNARRTGQRTALLFGPEDAGLANDEITMCHYLAHIPTNGASSLNLAQACLIMLYECLKATRLPPEKTRSAALVIDQDAQQRLEKNLKDALLQLDCLHGQNPDYFFIQWQQILRRAGLRRHEYDCLMGFCRQIRNKLQNSGGTPPHGD